MQLASIQHLLLLSMKSPLLAHALNHDNIPFFFFSISVNARILMTTLVLCACLQQCMLIIQCRIIIIITSIINHTFPSTIRGLIGTLLVQVWPIIAQAIVSAIRPYEYQKRPINPQLYEQYSP